MTEKKSPKTGQLTDTLIMVSPDQFGFNAQTAETNFFMKNPGGDSQSIQDKALAEFQLAVDKLRKHDIKILVLPSRSDAFTPDAVFPNNWFSLHANGQLVIYPMLVPSRREERQEENLLTLLSSAEIPISETIDISGLEDEGKILEGTGSLVLDRVNKVAFAMESERTSKVAFDLWSNEMGYEGVFFRAYDKDNLPIYHTNVVMSIGAGFAIACPDAITEKAERTTFLNKLQDYDRELIPISLEQVHQFCANILHVQSMQGTPLIIMSRNAYQSFSNEQLQRLKTHGEVIPIQIPTIEVIGGGSARCMLAEVFL